MSQALTERSGPGLKGAVGRPRKSPPQNAAEQIRDLAAGGRNLADIAAALSTSRDTLRRWMAEDEVLAIAFAIGREHERNELHQLILRDARDGEKPNVNAMFLLKARHGYREGEVADNGVPRISVTFNLPGALSREDFLRSVEPTIEERSA